MVWIVWIFFFPGGLDPVLDGGKGDEDAVVTPEVPGGGLVGKTIFGNQADGEILDAAGLIKRSEKSPEPYDRLRDRLIFPLTDIRGKVIGFGGRALDADAQGPKYLNSPETPLYHKGRELYGLYWAKAAIRKEEAALVVEGYMDYVSLAARGVENVVAALGTCLC